LLWLRYDKLAIFDDKAKEHIGSVTSAGCVVPENVIGKDKDKTETNSRCVISFYDVNRMVNICFV
jgi:hypothetical protein